MPRHYKNISSLINRGKSLETTVIYSQGSVICVDKFNSMARFKSKAERARDPDGGDAAVQRGPVDFIGEVQRVGRSIHFDAKMTGEFKGFRFKTLLKEYQAQHLFRHGEAGAICGVLIEATHKKLACFYWLDWRVLSKHWNSTGILFAWDLMTVLGDNRHNIRFDKIPEIAMILEKR